MSEAQQTSRNMEPSLMLGIDGALDNSQSRRASVTHSVDAAGGDDISKYERLLLPSIDRNAIVNCRLCRDFALCPMPGFSCSIIHVSRNIRVEDSDSAGLNRFDLTSPLAIIQNAFLWVVVERFAQACDAVSDHVTVGGGTQERLGLYIKRNLDYLPAIHCIGAAIAFLSGDQVKIPEWVDNCTWVGWSAASGRQDGTFPGI